MTRDQQQAILIANLAKRFGRKTVLTDMSFSVPMGAISGFLGPNGAGKTTTLRALLCLIRPNAGSVEMLGLPMPRFLCKALESTGAMVEKPSFIDNMSGFANLSWFGSLNRSVSKDRIMEILTKVGLADAASQSFGTYSTGMKQRLGVGFAILHRPALLILDEPTNGMDPQGRYQMREILREIHRTEGTTIFISSHLIDEIQKLCDYVVIVGKGKTIREGYVKDILAAESETWEFRFPEMHMDKAVEFLKNRAGIENLKRLPRGIEVLIRRDCSAELNAEMMAAGLKVSAIIPKEQSLEDLFIELTDQPQNGACG